MIIRSQDKLKICVLEKEFVIQVLRLNGKYTIRITKPISYVDLGVYSYINEALSVMDAICNNYGNSTRFDMPQEKIHVEEKKDEDTECAEIIIIPTAETSVSVLYENYDLSLRGYNCMKRAGGDYMIIEKVEQMDDEALGKVRNLGKRTLEDLRRAIRDWRTDQWEKQGYI